MSAPAYERFETADWHDGSGGLLEGTADEIAQFLERSRDLHRLSGFQRNEWHHHDRVWLLRADVECEQFSAAAAPKAEESWQEFSTSAGQNAIQPGLTPRSPSPPFEAAS